MNTDYIDFLIDEYSRRRISNPSYSERAFAKAVGVSPGYLNLLFQGKKQLSIERAKLVASKLTWTEEKKTAFLRKLSRSSEKSRQHLKGKFLLEEATFLEISDWFHFAILELIKVKGGSATTDQVCQSLRLSKSEAEFALRHLVKSNLLQKGQAGEFVVPDQYEMPSISSAGIRKFHKQTLQLALDAVEAQTLENRDLRALTLAFDQRQMDTAKKEIAKFVAAFEKKFSGGEKNAVYQMNLAFFQIDKGEK